MESFIIKTNNYINFSIYNMDGITKINEFSAYHNANKCLNGDIVSYTNNKCELIKRSSHILVGTLELNSKYKYGYTSRGYPICLFHPYNKEYPQFLVGTSEKQLINRVALIEFASWDINDRLPRGNLIKIFGFSGKKEEELISLKWLYGFPNIKINDNLNINNVNIKSEKYLNRKLLGPITFNIDPQGCKDIDDVLTLTKIYNNDYEIAITIADVSEYIIEGSEIDLAARKKGQSLYQNEKVVVPMIPHQISENNASLVSGEERLGISLIFNWINNKIENIHFCETRLINQKTYNYESIMNYSENSIIKDIAFYLKGIKTDDSHEWIEELMIFYNKEVAKLLVVNNVGLIRTHSEPEKEILAKYVNIDKELIFLAYESAQYEPSSSNKLHYGININSIYTHATSPLRRYADLINQRFLKLIINKKYSNLHQLNDINILANELNVLQLKQKKFERDVLFIEKITSKPIGKVEIIILENLHDKFKVYITMWKKKITIHKNKALQYNDLVKEGEKRIAEYYINLDAARWKERIVFRIKY